MYITWVHGETTADTYFSHIDFSKWKEVSREDHPSDEVNLYPYSFAVYERI